MSDVRKNYFLRLIGRIIIFVACIIIYFADSKSFNVINGMNFFKSFSVFHILWIIWFTDMLFQIIPVKNKIPLGSQKLFANRFRPIREKINRKALKNYISSTTKAAYRVFILWFFLIAVIGILFFKNIIDEKILFLISVFFYVCDLICVLIWCPFRLIMKNKCCTTCRIFNWDHLMMFSPLIFVKGFFSLSLFGFSLIAFLVWELCVLIYPERFWEMTNVSLKCSECTDKLCTQYCHKLR
ncbi:MAG: hypothetical protein J6V03_00100 [Clostridia bacterium]|nr:hypothetical protein [Clostridia bacterium]